MRLLSRLPLYQKVLVWFALNVALLAVALALFMGVQLRVPPDSPLAGKSGEQLRTAARLLGRELSETERADWQTALARYEAVYDAPLVLIPAHGAPISSGTVEAPQELVDAARLRLPRRPPRPEAPERGDQPGRTRPPFPPGAHPDPPLPGEMFTVSAEGHRWQTTPLQIAADHGPPVPGLLAMGADDSFTGMLAAAAPWVYLVVAALGLSGLWWIPFVRSLTRPLADMTEATEEIARGRFDVKVDASGRDEIGRLARGINRMSRRLDHYVHGQRRFLGDVAHELGSPIGRMQMGLGALEQRVDDANKERVADVLDDAEHLAGLVGELLSFTRAELNPARVACRSVELQPLAQRAVDRETQPDVSIVVDIDAELRVHADPELLVRAISNVLRNAVRYAGPDGPITVGARREGAHVRVTVADHGPGVPADALERIFEPFYRPDESRTDATGGAGLGLSIVKTCIEGCGGAVSARNLHQTEEGGFVVELQLPAG